MIFVKRYKDVIDTICGEVDYRVRQRLVALMEEFSQPLTLRTNRYDDNETEETDVFRYACAQFNDIMNAPHIQSSFMHMNIMDSGNTNLSALPLPFIFSVIEIQYENLYDHPEYEDVFDSRVIDEKKEFSAALNAFFAEYDIPWRILDGKMIKIDAQQFECDLKAKALAQMHELKDAEPKFQSAYTELTAAIDALEKGDYQATISNAGKSYESVLKVILGVDTGNANDLTTQYMNRLLTVPDTMQASGFRTNVMMALPYIRNKSGSDHGAGAQEVVISKPMAKLAVNLAAALDTYLIEEYAARMTEAES